MYRLYFAPGTAAMAPHCALIETGAPYELIGVDLAKREHDGAAYRRLNPNGRVPVLADGETVLFEAAAICLYLAAKHPAAGLMPPPGTPDHGRALQWLVYLTNTVQEGFIQWFHPDWQMASESGRAELKASAERRLSAMWDVVDAGLSQAPYLAGPAPGLPDIYLAMLTRWSRFLPHPAWTRGHIRRAVGAVIARPAFRRMMAEQGIAWAENWPG
jgi:glutathione S-transferase